MGRVIGRTVRSLLSGSQLRLLDLMFGERRNRRPRAVGCLSGLFMGGGASKKKAVDGANVDIAGRNKLGSLMSDAGITKVILIRHANAKPRDPEAAAMEAGTVLKPDTPFANAWTVGDLTRALTDKGEEQAVAARGYLGAHELRCVICSEAVRATRTQEIMTEGKLTSGQHLTLHTLHPSRSGTPDCEKMFDKLGYGTLNMYYADASVPGLEGQGKPVFRVYMNKVTGELFDLICKGLVDLPRTGDTVAIFGHAVFLNAVAVAVAEAQGIEQAEVKVAELELGEAQGILCDASAATIGLCKA